MKLVLGLCLLGIFSSAKAYRSLQSRLPNGDQVPHPCKPNVRWQGVGHENALGGGPRNPFGRDFAANGLKWDVKICRADSDGDGRTNGEELGDPDCTWNPGQIPKTLSNLGHPGVCEPIQSEECKKKNNWDFCKSDTFDCQYIKSPDVKNITLHMNKVKVPAKETTYFCAAFDLPDDQEYHLIASKPHIDNAYVMHHMIFYGCEDESGGDNFAVPRECGMEVSQGGECQGFLGGWTLGSTGECHNKNAGIPIGVNGYKRVIIEYHWNNVELEDDYIDSSGVTFYYTNKLRPNELGILTLGDVGLSIAPGQELTSYHAKCSGDCTKSFLPHSLFVTQATIHMHYLGHSGIIRHMRDGRRLDDLAKDDVYSYDSPTYYKYEVPVEIKPGDVLSLTCNFKSKYRQNITYYGEGTSDEMCFGFISYFPKQKGLESCIDFNDLDLCEMRLPDMASRSEGLAQLSRCNFTKFYTQYIEEIMRSVMGACYTFAEGCTPDCIAAIANVRTNNPCMIGDVGIMNQFTIRRNIPGDGPQFVRMMRACDITQRPMMTMKDGRQMRMPIKLAAPMVSGASCLLPHIAAVFLMLSVLVM